jgi:hypothetical protein
MSERVSTCAPRMNPLIPVPMDEPSWYHRRVLRSLKKVFQSRWSGGVCVALLADEVSGEEGGGVLIEEAYRIEMLEVLGLNITLRFASVARRLGWEEESWVRRGVGEVV